MTRVATCLAVAVLAFPVAGCWKEQQQVFAKCAALHPYTGKYLPRAHVETPMSDCMSDAGYKIDYDTERCANIVIPRRSPYCYEPKGWAGRMGFKVEMIYTPGPQPPLKPEL